MTETQSIPSPHEALIARAMADPGFRDELVDDPEGALREAGIELSPEEMQHLTSMTREEREQMAEQLDSRQSASVYGKLADLLDNPGSFNPTQNSD